MVFVAGGGNPYETDRVYDVPTGLALGLLGLELLSTLGNRHRRALHDLIAGSVVVRLDAPRSSASHPEPLPADLPDEAPARPLKAGEFACPVCGTPVRFGASHCHTCERLFRYRDGQPMVSP
jgi:hypothetical protein